MKNTDLAKGMKILLSQPIKTKCCNHTIPIGKMVSIWSFHSLTRQLPLTKQVVIHEENGGLHMIKTSSLQGTIL